jgi:hypothetical protein
LTAKASNQMKIDIKENKITRFDENRIKKEHLPFSTGFDEIEVVPDGRLIILENFRDFDHNGKSNVYCLNRNLEIDWYLPLPNQQHTANDVYVGFTTNDERYFANSWSGYRVEIDTKNGNPKDIEFLK